MLVSTVKAFVFINPQMVLKDIWRWILWVFLLGCAFPCACRRRGVASAFFTHCTKASLSDDLGLIEMLIDNINYFKSKPVNIPKITIDADKSFLLDHGYHPRKLQEAFFRSLSWYYAKN